MEIRKIMTNDNSSNLVFDNPAEEIRYLKDKVETLQQCLDKKNLAENELTSIKNNILKNLNHEFRTPMTSILGFSEVLAEKLSQAEDREIAEKIFDAGNRLMNTLNSVVVLARLESDQEKFSKAPCNIGDAVKEIVNQFKPQAEYKKLLMLFFQRNMVFCEINKVLFQQAVANLIDNAVKFTRNGTIKVEVSEVIEKNIPVAKIDIKDTGIGIPAEFYEVIFEDFRQVSEGDQRSFEGSGIGLSLGRRLIRLMEGEIEVKSTVGQGSIFTIKIPALQILTADTSDNQVVHYLGRNQHLKKIIPSSHNLPNVLLVEDNRVNTALIKHYLGQFCHLTCAYDGQSGVSMATIGIFDAILMDINLGPGINGVEALKQIKTLEKYTDIPVIAVTGYANDGDEDRFLQQGFSHYLAKPFSKDKLLNLLHDVLY